MRTMAAVLTSFLAAAWLLAGTAAPAHAQTNVLYMNSQAGDYIGGGAKATYTTGTFSRSGGGRVVTISFSNSSHWWTLNFAALEGQVLEPGVYEGATRYPFQSPTHPGLSVSGDGRGCNTLTGRFTILEIAYDLGGAVQRFAADFEQHCEGMTPALFGAIRFNSAVTIVPRLSIGDASAQETATGAPMTFTVSLNEPLSTSVTVHWTTGDGSALAGRDYVAAAGDVTFTPSQTSRPITIQTLHDAAEENRTFYVRLSEPAGAQIADAEARGTIRDGDGPQTYFLLDSSPGDYIGGGVRQTVTNADGAFVAEIGPNTQVVHVGFDGDTWWNFYAIGTGGARVAPGSYEGAARYPFQTASQPGLSFSGDGRGCNTLRGRFDVLELTYGATGAIQTFAANFVQYCETTMPPLYGAVRFNSRIPAPAPPSFLIAVSKLGAGSGTVTSSPEGIACGADCEQSYEMRTSLTLTATPAAGSIFTGWGGGCSGTGTCQMSVFSARTITATFLRTFQLTVGKTGAASGTVTSSPAGISCGTDCDQLYAEGTSVSLSATPDSSARFAGWSGDCSGTTSPFVVTMNGTRSCTATFSPWAILQLSAPSYAVAESAGPATIVVTRSGDVSSAVSVRLATSNGSAEANADYAPQSITVPFASGVTSVPVPIAIQADALTEGWETVDVTLFQPSAGAVLGTRTMASLTILDDDGSALYFASPRFGAVESAGSVRVKVRRSGSSSEAASVIVATTAVTAIGGSDFTPTKKTVSFAPGQLVAEMTVPILSDSANEGFETFRLSLQNPVGATLGTQHVATATIVDDEPQKAVSFGVPSYEIGESGGSLIVTVHRSGDPAGTVTVESSTSALTATAGADYGSVWNVLTFAPGVTSQTFTVAIVGDAGYDGDETFLLSLMFPNGAVLGTQKQVIATIKDDD